MWVPLVLTLSTVVVVKAHLCGQIPTSMIYRFNPNTVGYSPDWYGGTNTTNAAITTSSFLIPPSGMEAPIDKPTEEHAVEPTSSPTSMPTEKSSDKQTEVPKANPKTVPVAEPTNPPKGEPSDDSIWTQIAKNYNDALQKWGNPDCYTYTIARSCFCTQAIRNPTSVKVVNGLIIEPANYKDLFLHTMQDMFAHVNRLCVEDSPEKAAKCDIRYGNEYGNLEYVFIDESEMIADEETKYTISNYSNCQ